MPQSGFIVQVLLSVQRVQTIVPAAAEVSCWVCLHSFSWDGRRPLFAALLFHLDLLSIPTSPPFSLCLSAPPLPPCSFSFLPASDWQRCDYAGTLPSGEQLSLLCKRLLNFCTCEFGSGCQTGVGLRPLPLCGAVVVVILVIQEALMVKTAKSIKE